MEKKRPTFNAPEEAVRAVAKEIVERLSVMRSAEATAQKLPDKEDASSRPRVTRSDDVMAAEISSIPFVPELNCRAPDCRDFCRR